MLKLQPESLDWALAHVLTRGDTDILPLPFEYEAIAFDWEPLRSHLADIDIDTFAVRDLRRCLAPKHGLGLRIATQLDPLDTLIICALVYEVGTQFEAVRVPKSENRVFSYRFLPAGDGQMYDPSVTYSSFRARSLKMAQERPSGYMVITDIADFFPRLYAHPMENAMRVAAASAPDHARVITKLISAWNMSVSYGIPVGPAPFRLISEVTIADVDQALLAEGVDFCRFSDDFRIGVATEREGRLALATLAQVLSRNHGLTLQESKTEIIPASDFISRFSLTERDKERERLNADFSELLDAIGLDAGYLPIDYGDLSPELQEMVDSLNLWALISDEIWTSGSLDIPVTRFALSRIKQLGRQDEQDLLLPNLRRLAPVFREVLEALVAQDGLSGADKSELGGRLLDLFEHDTVGYLEYHREWILYPFQGSREWNQTDRLVRLTREHFDQMTVRALTLALGRANQGHWFRPRKEQVFQFSPWNRRAFLYAASSLPGDEAKHWYGSIAPRLDPLDRAVVKYARAHPMG
jgi:hypothetical protein